MAAPAPLLVQLPQVVSSLEADTLPSGVEPVRMSCVLGRSPRPFTVFPFSLTATSRLMLLTVCSSSTLRAINLPSKLYHGPLPMRSRALTAGSLPLVVALRYARQVRLPAPAAVASD